MGIVPSWGFHEHHMHHTWLFTYVFPFDVTKTLWSQYYPHLLLKKQTHRAKKYHAQGLKDGSDSKKSIQHLVDGFLCGSDGKASACNAGDLGLIPGSGRSPGEGNGKPLQYSCLGNPMNGGAWQAIVHGVAKSQTQLSDFTFTTFGRLSRCARHSKTRQLQSSLLYKQ